VFCCAIQCLPRNLATQGAERSEGKGGGDATRGSAALHCCCAIAFLEVSALQQLPHGAITLQYYYHGSTVLCWALAALFNFLILNSVGRTHWTGDQPVARSLPIHRTTQTQNKRTIQTSIPSVGFEPTIPAFQRAKTVHSSDSAATVIGTT
jgi:hypothetical protein